MDDHILMRTKGSKGKKGLITKTWERCKSIGRGHKSYKRNIIGGSLSLTTRSKSWPNLDAKILDDDDEEEKDEEQRGANSKKGRVAPEGCFSVYVGPQMQRFVIKAEYANHPLFKMLLEEAESEYGYSSQGPLALPCNVDIFHKVLAEMDEETRQGCAFGKRSPRSYHLLSPSPMLAINHS